MPDEFHVFTVQCIGCGRLPRQTRSIVALRHQLQTGREIFNCCSNCDRAWPADHLTRELLAGQLSVNDWR